MLLLVYWVRIWIYGVVGVLVAIIETVIFKKMQKCTKCKKCTKLEVGFCSYHATIYVQGKDLLVSTKRIFSYSFKNRFFLQESWKENSREVGTQKGC